MHSKPTFLILSGGPGLKKDCDRKHDQSWSNYVDALLGAAKAGTLRHREEGKIIWMVYEPAFELRWLDDRTQKNPAADKVINDGFTSYLDKLQKRARQYGFDYRALKRADDFWGLLTAQPPHSIRRLWYFGHGQENLWLRLDHSSKCKAVAPKSTEIVYQSSIASQAAKLKNRIYVSDAPTYNRSAATKFYGCRTKAFAREWATCFGTFAEGASSTLEFEDTWKPGLQDVFTEYERRSGWNRFKPNGMSF
jgi:hypothetical protein